MLTSVKSGSVTLITMMVFRVLIFLAAGSGTVDAFRSYRARDVLNPPDTVVVGGESSNDGSDVVVAHFAQPIDHFDALAAKSVNATLFQRYFYSNRHVRNRREQSYLPTYAFICVGGEGPGMDESVLIDSVHCSGDMLELAKRLARKANVHLIALEHRYYGDSYPTFYDENGDIVPALATENMKYLSSKQALADLANCVKTWNLDLPKSTKWVTFGGSYPGFLAAMARQFYPNLIHAAVSSSAPVDLLLDFVGYKERQAFDLQYDTVGGSADCLKTVMDGHVELEDTIAAGNYQDVADMFGLCDASSLKSERNLGMFLGDGVVDVPAQGNDPSCQYGSVCNLRKFCDFLQETQDNGASAMEGLAKLAEQQRGPFGCVALDWNETLAQLSNTETDPDNWRSWIWQTCTEVGYYQTCETDTLCPFGRGFHLIGMDYEICQVAFGLSEAQVKRNVEDTTNYYGDIRQRATRVLSVNGDVDPWSVLAILESNNPLMPAHVVKGASHHFWTHPVKETDNQEIKDARDIIYLQVMEWLEQPADEVFEAIE